MEAKETIDLIEIKEEVKDEYLRDIHCVANAIGYELFKDRRKVEFDDQGIGKVWLEEEDILLVHETATRVLKELIILGWSKVNPDSGNTHLDGSDNDPSFY